MTLNEIIKALNLEILVDSNSNATITCGYTSDLLSDVMANAEEGAPIITIQAHKNTIAVATLSEAPAVIICNNRPINDDMIDAARMEEIALLRTDKNQYTVSGEIYSLLKDS